MTTKKIKTSDVLGDNYYIYELSSSNYTPALNGTITITCTVTDVYGDSINNKSITLYKNGTSVSTKTTNSSGVATWSVTCSDAGIQSFKVGNKAIEVFVDNKSDTGHTHTTTDITNLSIPSASNTTPSADTTSGSVGTGTTWARSNHTHPKSSLYAESSHTHSQYLTEHQSLANYVTTSDSRLSDARTPTSHAHGNLQNNGQVGSTAQANKNVVTNSSGLITTENKPTIPSKTSQLTNDSGFLTSHQSLDSKTVTVEKLATAESGYLSSYAVKQNGVQVGNTINIPKDFLVKSGSVKTVSTANSPVNGYSVGDKYIDLVINVQEGTSTDSHIYILVSDLVDTPVTISDVTGLQSALDGKIDTNLTYATATGNNDEILCKTYDDGKIHTTSAIQANWVKDLVAHVGSGGIGSAGGDAQSGINTKINTALVNLKADKEDNSNKVTSLSSSSTDTQYPSAKLVYDQLNNKAPTSHASTATTYGVSNASNYGHSMASSTNPKMDGTATVGSETAKFARGDHIHPTDTSRAPTSHASTANTYGLGSTSNYGHVKTINNLTQSSHSDGTALSAYQGKVLNDTKADKSQVVDWDNIVFVDKTDNDTGAIILNFLD